MSTATRALAWMLQKKAAAEAAGRLALFRGQSKVWPTIQSSITRLDDSEKEAMWRLCACVMADRARQSQGIAGYVRVGEAHRLALLQHYLACSPLLDVSGTPEVALYFAIGSAPVGSTCVVYSIDLDRAVEFGCEVAEHDQLLLPLSEGGAKHRWMRQDAFSIGRKPWHDRDANETFDLLDVPGIEAFPIHRLPGDHKLIGGLGDLESVANDPLATSVRSFIDMTIQHYNIQGLEDVLSKSKTNDRHGTQARQIATWIEALEGRGDADAAILEALRKLQREWAGYGRGMDFQAAFEYWQAKFPSTSSDGGP